MWPDLDQAWKAPAMRACLVIVGPVFNVYVTDVFVVITRYGWQEFVIQSIDFYIKCRWIFEFAFGGWWHAAERPLVRGMQRDVLDDAGGVLHCVQDEHAHGETNALVLVEASPSR